MHNLTGQQGKQTSWLETIQWFFLVTSVLCPSYFLVPFPDSTGALAEEGQKKKVRLSEVILAVFCLFKNN